MLDILSQAARLAKEAKLLDGSKVWGEKDLGDEAARETKLRTLNKSVEFLCSSLQMLNVHIAHVKVIADSSLLTCSMYGYPLLVRNYSASMRALLVSSGKCQCGGDAKSHTNHSHSLISSILGAKAQWEAVNGKK